MILGMTGFATKTLVIVETDGTRTQVSLNLKTLNSRFLEVNCKIPYALSHLETEFVKFFKQHLYRGNVTLTIFLSNPNFFKGAVEPSLSTAQSYLNAMQTIQHTLQLPGQVTINDIIPLPNIFSIEEKSIDEKTKEKIFNSIYALVDDLNNLRKIEGKSIYQDLQNRCIVLSQEINKIESIAEQIMQKRKEEVAKELQKLENQAGDQLNESQKSSLYHELDKIDIHEEIIRFNSHLENLKTQLDSAEIEKGRRIDFIVQELLREINTIGAKCPSITSIAITIKVELEKIREQAQNIV